MKGNGQGPNDERRDVDRVFYWTFTRFWRISGSGCSACKFSCHEDCVYSANRTRCLYLDSWHLRIFWSCGLSTTGDSEVLMQLIDFRDFAACEQHFFVRYLLWRSEGSDGAFGVGHASRLVISFLRNGLRARAWTSRT